MAFDPENKGAPAPDGDNSSTQSGSSTPPVPADVPTQAGNVSYTPTVDDSYGSYDDPYGYNVEGESSKQLTSPAAPTPPPPPPPPPPTDESDDEEEGMLRMSFMEHLEELRKRLIHTIGGLAVVFVLCLTFCDRLWIIVQEPAVAALKELGVKPPNLVMLAPMDGFQIIWMKLPLLCTIFLGSPWILYQIWSFIAPGLYKKERRFAAPFVITSAGLFITGGLFAYFVAFRYGLTFLLGIGYGYGVTPFISITEYFDLFVDVMLGIGLVFEMPVIIFFLTFLRIASPSFLLSHSRYAILIITIIAAVVTPTPDVFNLMLFAVPMCLLYFIGIFASYVLVLKRENRRFPWGPFWIVMGVIALLIAIGLYIAIHNYHYKLVLH